MSAAGRILVVEDEAIIADLVAGMLRRAGYAIAGIEHEALAAVARALETRPDLVLMDIRLAGGGDGIAAAEEIRRSLDVPVIFLTAYSDDATIQRAKQAAPFGYVTKPFQERELLTTVDIALYKQRMDREARERERWLRTVLTSIGDAVVAVDAALRIRFVNPLAEALVAMPLRELEGRLVTEALHFQTDAGSPFAEHPVQTAVRTGDRVDLPRGTRLVGGFGVKVAVEGTATLIPGEPGLPPGAVLALRDVTERLHAEEKYRKMSQVVEQTADLVMVTDRYGRIEYVNPAFEQFTGFSMDEALGGRPSISKSGQHDNEFYARMWETILSGRTFRTVITNRKRDGSLYFEEKNISPMRDANGVISHFISTGRDVTARIEAARAAAESAERLEHIAKSLGAVLFTMDRDTRRLLYTTGSELVFGIPVADLAANVGLVRSRIHAEDMVRAQRELASAQESFSLVVRYERPGDGWRWLRINAAAARYQDRPILNGMVLDVTDRVMADRDAARTRQRLEEISHSLETVLFSYSVAHRTVYNVTGSERVFGGPPERAWPSLEGFLAALPPGDGERVMAAATEGVRSRRPFQVEFQYQRADGVRWMRAHCNPVRVDGALVVHGIVFDVTEQKALELRAETSGKLAALGLLSAGIAHELNNPLASMSARLQRLQHKPTPELWQDSAAFFELQLKRMTQVIRRISAFSRLQSGVIRECRLERVVADTLDLVRYDPRMAAVEIETSLPEAVVPVAADPGHVSHAVLNLVSNALDALGGKGRIRVAVSRTDGGCRLSVEDDGPGVPEDIRSRIFDPFVSTKDAAKGMGLGLYLSRVFIESGGGKLTLLESAPGRTVFALDFSCPPQSTHAANPAH